MKKFLILFTLFILNIGLSFSQDVIYKKNGEEIKAKVKKVGPQEIEYSKIGNETGPIYSISKSDVLLIIYSNGSKDIFSNSETSSGNTTANNNTAVSTSPVSRPQARYRASDIFNKNNSLVWYGVDYSRVKLIGVNNLDNANVFTEINNLILAEKPRYDVKGAMRKYEVSTDMAAIEKRNSKIDFAQLQSGTSNAVTWADLQSIVDSYGETEGTIKDGMGIAFIAENLTKNSGTGSYFVVIFDIASKNILVSDKVIGGAGGNGQRNYWARTVLESIQKIKDVKYAQWRYANK